MDIRTRLAPYLQVAPLTLVFALFFLLPIALVVVVSFFDYQAYQILIPAFTLQNYVDVFSSNVTYRTYMMTIADVDVADRLVSHLYDSILDVECHPYDCVDSSAGPQRLGECGPSPARIDRAALGVASLLRVFRHSGLYPLVHLVYDGPDFQRHGSH
jgi:ABC-type sugar transport system permease subunit